MNLKYTLTVTEEGQSPETVITDDRKVYMDAVYAATSKGGMWMREQTTYLALVDQHSPLMVADDRVSITARYEP